jgi:chromosome segregation ATPase
MLTDLIFSLPVISFMLILIAGTLVGYALCNPFSAERHELSQELRQLRRQNELMQGELTRQRELQARVERNTIEQRNDNLKLRASQLELAQKMESVRVDAPEKQEPMSGLRRQLSEAERLLSAEKHARVGLEERIRELQLEQSRLQAQAAATHRLTEQRDLLQALYRQARQEIDRIRTERDALAAESSVTKGDVERLRESVRTAQQTADRIRQQREEVLHDLRQAQHERAKVAHLLRDANEHAESLAIKLRQEGDRQAEKSQLQSKVESARHEVRQLEVSRAQLDNAYGELRRAHAMLQQELAHRSDIITRLRAERDRATAALARQELIAGVMDATEVETTQCIVAAKAA